MCHLAVRNTKFKAARVFVHNNWIYNMTTYCKAGVYTYPTSRNSNRRLEYVDC